MITLYGVDDQITREVIEKVLPRLPEDVTRLVMRSCLFISAGDVERSSSRMLPVYVMDSVIDFVIVLTTTHMRSPWAQDIVAHEIAHAWLHHTFEYDSTFQEEEADELAVEWGFKSKAECV